MMRLIFALALIFWLSTVSYCGESVKSKDYFVDGPVVVPLTSTVETSTVVTLSTAEVVLTPTTTNITLVESFPDSLSDVGPTITALTEGEVDEGTMATLLQNETLATILPHVIHVPKQSKPTEINLSNYVLTNTNSIDNSANSEQSLPQVKNEGQGEKDSTFGLLFGIPLLVLLTLCCCALLFCLCNRCRRSGKCKMHGREKFKNSPLIKKTIDDGDQCDATMSDVQVVEFRHEQPLHLSGPVAEPFTDLHIPIQIKVTDETEAAIVEDEKAKLLGTFDPENHQQT